MVVVFLCLQKEAAETSLLITLIGGIREIIAAFRHMDAVRILLACLFRQA
jgi:hypothetical protein